MREAVSGLQPWAKENRDDFLRPLVQLDSLNCLFIVVAEWSGTDCFAFLDCFCEFVETGSSRAPHPPPGTEWGCGWDTAPLQGPELSWDPR